MASATGYSLGIVAHWLLSSRAVFQQGVAARGPQRTRQKAMFVGSALFGLALLPFGLGLLLWLPVMFVTVFMAWHDVCGDGMPRHR